MKKNDCFSMHNGECAALNETNCLNCKFYRTKAAMRKSRERAAKRIRGLDKVTQTYIAEKYSACRLVRREGAAV